jgi:integrase
MASIRKRHLKQGKVAWQVDYKDLRAKRRHKQFKTRREADHWLVNARAEIAEGTHVAASDSITFKQAGDAWIANCRRRKLEDTTINSYQQHLDAHIFPFLGHKKLNELTNVATTTFYEDLLDGKRSQDMVRRVRIDAGAVLNYAKSKGWVGKNVIEDTPFEYSKRDNKRPDMPSIEEAQRIIAGTKRSWDGWLAFLYVLVFCALRASEVRALAWGDIDFANARLTVSRRADRWGRIGRPKSKAGTRDIPFPPAVGAALRGWKPRCPSSRLDLVFPSGKGTVANQSNIMNRYFRPMQIEAGILTEIIQIKPHGKELTKKRAKYGLNALRHFCASLWIEANYDPKRVQTLMGHASIKQTYDTYGYLFELRKADVEALKRTQDRVLMA